MCLASWTKAIVRIEKIPITWPGLACVYKFNYDNSQFLNIPTFLIVGDPFSAAYDM